MAKTRTSKFIIAAMSPEERAAHYYAVRKRAADRYKEIANRKKREKYALNPSEVIKKQRERILRSPERQEARRRAVRMSRSRKPWLKALNASIVRAKAGGIVNTLTKEWALSTYTGVCVLTGLPFVVNTGEVAVRRGGHPYSPSIDKIDPKKGYTPNNCRFVIWVVNKFKDTMSDEEMYRIAEALLANRKP